MVFPLCVDAVEGSISAEDEASLFSERICRMAATGMHLFLTFLFMSVSHPLGMDAAFCKFAQKPVYFLVLVH